MLSRLLVAVEAGDETANLGDGDRELAELGFDGDFRHRKIATDDRAVLQMEADKFRPQLHDRSAGNFDGLVVFLFLAGLRCAGRAPLDSLDDAADDPFHVLDRLGGLLLGVGSQDQEVEKTGDDELEGEFHRAIPERSKEREWV